MLGVLDAARGRWPCSGAPVWGAAVGERPQDTEAALLRDLHEAREHLAATTEVLAVLGRAGSDVDAILGAVVDNARQLCRADAALIYLLDRDVYTLARASGASDEAWEYIVRHPFALDRGTLIGRVGLSRTAGQIEDVLTDPDYGRTDAQRVAGYRTVMAAPMLLDDDVVGMLNLWRYRVEPFDQRAMTLVTAFAAHAAVAIRNVHLMRALEQRSAELEVASQHKSEFLASMSHELRTPLNAIIGFSEVLLERMFGDLNVRQDEYLHDILSSGRLLLELLNDILDLSKVEAGQLQLEPSRFSVAEALDYGAAMVRERAARHGIDLRSEIDSDVGDIEADELRFKQVVLNLVSNAVKFTPDGGKVTVGASRTGDEVTVLVTDTGVGIADSDRDRIFESFQQSGRSPNRQEGTGLGLTLCRRIVELQGGRIWVESEVGAGSTFGFAIPARALYEPDGEPESSPPPGRSVVLVIEDDPTSVDLLDVYLERTGFELTVARNGAEGLDAVRRLKPDAVILDIRLPGLFGWDVLAAIKADPATANIPVVVTSVLDDRARGMALGAAAYLVKPISRDEVIGALTKVLDGGRLAPTTGGER
jgi:signal transduction histidine kinase/ActR/RegA family two-component response regulator